MKTYEGFPVVDSADTLSSVLESLDLSAWPVLKPAVPLGKYIESGLTESQEKELKFAPKVSATIFQHPNGDPYTAFTVPAKSWATVIAFMETQEFGELIPMTAEFKAGRAKIVLVPPCGVPNKDENQMPEEHRWPSCARREFQEETGLPLKSLRPLSGPLSTSVRNTDMACYPFLGELESHTPNQNLIMLDDTEVIGRFLLSVQAFQELITKTLPHPYELEQTTAIIAIALLLR